MISESILAEKYEFWLDIWLKNMIFGIHLDPFGVIWGSFGIQFGIILASFWGPFWYKMASRGPGADWTIERSNHMCFFDQSAISDHIVSTKWPPCVPFATYTIQVEFRLKGGHTNPSRLLLDA